MKKLIAFFLIMLASQFFNGCAETNIQHISSAVRLPESNNLHASYSEVWRATIHALSENEIIKIMDENVGTAVTEYRTVDNIELDALKTALFGKTFKYSYTLNLSRVNEAKTLVKIKVNLLSQQFGFYERGQSNLELESYLRKKLFSRIQNKLRSDKSKSRGKVSSYNHEHQYPPSAGKIPSLSDSLVKRIQQSLLAANYNPGPVDGIMGDKTRKALRNYQKDNQLAVTGSIDDDTIRCLGIIGGEKPKKIGLKGFDNEKLRDEPIVTTPSGSKKIEDSVKDKKELPPTLNKQEKTKEEKKIIDKEEFIVISRGILEIKTSMLSQASIVADTIDEIPKGSTVDIIEKQNNFYKVRYNGKEGFVYSSFIKETR